MTTNVRIIADDRERASGVPELLGAMEGVVVEVRHLSLGDYVIDDRVIVERKTIEDFAISIMDGRLFRQATRLVKCRYRPAMLIEGRRLPTSAVPRHALQGALVSLTLVFDIPLLRSHDAPDTARLLAYSARQLATTESRARGVRLRKPKRAHTRRIHVLSSLPGIGREIAARLLETFGSVENVVMADVESLARIPRLGMKRAAVIRAVLSETDDEPEDP